MVAAVLLALLAPAAGGGTSPGAEVVLMAGIGLAAVGLPVRGVRRGYLIGAGVLLMATLGWTWPASLVVLPWRERLAEAGFPLTWMSSPEPWVSLRAWLLLLGGVVWGGWCAGQMWTGRSRRRVCEGLSLGMGGIALVALVSRGGHVWGWPAGTGLGPFENRNQTALLFAVGAFLTVVCGVERFRKNPAEKGAVGKLMLCGLGWLCLLGVYTAALAVNRSRSGPVLFAGMTVVWALTVKPPWKRRPETMAAGLAIALLLGTVFLLTGRGVIARLAGTQLLDFRLKIFSDTIWLIRASPWTGTGLGCFSAIFPLYRHALILQERVLHPESDWLWLTAEAGLPGLVALAGCLGWMGVRAWREVPEREEERGLGVGLCVACLGMLAHSFVDVPGHRLGTVMPGLLLAGMAVGGEAEMGRWRGWVLRGMGAGVLGMGVWGAIVLVAGVQEPMLGTALEWTPLDWRLYADRAFIEGNRKELTAALRDFRQARFLEPNYAGLPFAEGNYWLGVAPRLAVEPWEEALRRTVWEGRPELYQNILAEGYPGHAELHADLWAMGASDTRLQMVYLGWATAGEFREELGDILHEDPGLHLYTVDQLKKLFPIWLNKGDAEQLASLLQRRPDWLRVGYRTLAEYDAGRGEWWDALDLMERYLPAPKVPEVAMSEGEAARRFAQDKGDVAAGMALYHQAIVAGRDADALDALEGMSASRGCPGYVHYLEGQLLVKQEKMAEGWRELEAYAESMNDPSSPGFAGTSER